MIRRKKFMKKHNYSFITLLLTITLPLSPAASASSVWDPPYLVENAFVAGSDINDEPLYAQVLHDSLKGKKKGQIC
jgi:hypothetical protein